tara:strand:+ start:130 stop:1161 length:1032 start_codon:yes stop_codon:yes gene_type:complete
MHTILCLFLFTSLTSCGILGPEKEKPLEPGPRNYTWEVDTLYSPPGGYVYDIWGSSPNDVWAVLGTGTNTLWHFDGESWEPWSERVGPALYSIYGFANNDVWMGGNDGKIYHFDGESWKLSVQIEINEARLIDTYSIWGEPSNLYVAGIVVYFDDIPQSFIYRYDGKEWIKVLVTDFKVQLQRIRTKEERVFLQGININSQPDSFFFYALKGDELMEIFSTPSSNNTEVISLHKIGEKIYFVVGSTINKVKNNSLIKWKEISSPDFGYQIYGRHEKDIFLRMKNGLVHYNGEDISYLFDLNNTLFSISNNAILFEDEVFFIVNDFDEGTNYIYHGILTDQQEE